MNARERREISERLANTPPTPSLLIDGHQLIHRREIRLPAVDTLFLAAPITFENRLVQGDGRIARPHPGKATATVPDSYDQLTPVLAGRQEVLDARRAR